MTNLLANFKAALNGDFDPELHDDVLLDRFLRARQNDIPKAKEMFLKAQAWRKAENIDELVKTFTYPEFHVIDSIYPRYTHKTDKVGRPIVINEMAKLNMTDLLAGTTEDRFLKEHIREIEKLTRYRVVACTKLNPAVNNQIFTIIDLKGVSLTVFPSVRGVIAAISQIDTEYFPETLGAMAIINAPLLFTAVWAIIKNFLDQKTLDKIHIFGSNYKPKLLNLVEKENLPEYLGGSCECEGGCRNSDSGPWNDGSVLGYPIEFWESFRKRDELARKELEASDTSTLC